MTIAFFVQNNHVTHLTAQVAQYAHQHGYAVEDRSSTSTMNPDATGIDWLQYDVVIPFGSVQFLRKCKDSSLNRFIHHNEERFAASYWVPIFGDLALNNSGLKASLKRVTKLLQSSERYHLRPDKIDKAFTGGVYDLNKWSQTVELLTSLDIDCWVSPILEIKSEWRCWIIGGEVISISKYRDDGKLTVAAESSNIVLDAATRLAAIYLPAECVVMDMAISEKGYSVIEFNPIHGSGWYAADVNKVLDRWVKWSENYYKNLL